MKHLKLLRFFIALYKNMVRYRLFLKMTSLALCLTNIFCTTSYCGTNTPSSSQLNSFVSNTHPVDFEATKIVNNLSDFIRDSGAETESDAQKIEDYLYELIYSILRKIEDGTINTNTPVYFDEYYLHHYSQDKASSPPSLKSEEQIIQELEQLTGEHRIAFFGGAFRYFHLMHLILILDMINRHNTLIYVRLGDEEAKPGMQRNEIRYSRVKHVFSLLGRLTSNHGPIHLAKTYIKRPQLPVEPLVYYQHAKKAQFDFHFFSGWDKLETWRDKILPNTPVKLDKAQNMNIHYTLYQRQEFMDQKKILAQEQARDYFEENFHKVGLSEKIKFHLAFPKTALNISSGGLIKKNLPTKAGTLQFLKPQLTKSTIDPLLEISVDEFLLAPQLTVSLIQNYFPSQSIIVRSNAFDEDNPESGKAGSYTSVPKVSTNDPAQILEAIHAVIQSYQKDGPSNYHQYSFFIQPMIQDVIISGVIFTKELSTGTPYYSINFSFTNKTDAVTSGTDFTASFLILKNLYHHVELDWIRDLIEAVIEIENITESDDLDLEFAITKDLTMHIFQVRKMVSHPSINRDTELKIQGATESLLKKVIKYFAPQKGVFGNTSILGQMPDVNPLELIGATPWPIESSLYASLITNNTWRQARGEMGYTYPKKGEDAPLMLLLNGKPYVDVRLSFNSFLPNNLPDHIKERLANEWISYLKNNPQYHDKVEFEVILSAFRFDIEDLYANRYRSYFSREEYDLITQELVNLTDRFILGKDASIESQITLIKDLNRERDSFLKRKTSAMDYNTLNSLQNLIREKGTLPFIKLARHAFISLSILDSLINMDILSHSDKENFLKSFDTISTQFVSDISRVKQGTLSNERFFKKYGHLRPHTYSISSERYQDRQDSFSFDSNENTYKSKPFQLSQEKIDKINYLLSQYGFEAKHDDLFNYMKKSIIAREYAKFHFSKVVSDLLEVISYWGEELGFTRQELSYLDINFIATMLNSYFDKSTLREMIQSEIMRASLDYKLTELLPLPYLIIDSTDIFQIPTLPYQPNFITRKKISAKKIHLNGTPKDHILDLKGKIIFIKNADPGFEWIFSHNIAGLITAVGGPGSHMAIRCQALHIPAAIGIGKDAFRKLTLSKAPFVLLDAEDKIVKPHYIGGMDNKTASGSASKNRAFKINTLYSA